MLKLCLAASAIVLILAGASSAATLEWPAELVTLSSGKSIQSVPVLAAEQSAEAVESSSSSAQEEDELSESSSGNSQNQLPELSSSEAGEVRSISAVPISVPLPLIVAARSGLRTVLTIQEPTVAKVGEVVHHVPTAVSHQSQTVVHDHKRLVTPIVAPALRTTQLVRHQEQPVVWAIADPRVVIWRN